MNIIKKIKSIIKPAQTSSSIVDFFYQKTLNSSSKPEGISEKEWRLVLNKINHALDKLSKDSRPSSIGRQRVLAKEIKEGMDLFQKYLKYINK
jgi:hypothetical protein